jgi:hypothetical protein
MTATNKRLLKSKSRGDSNWCTPYRGNLTNMICMLPTPVYVHPAYTCYGWSPYVTTFYESPTGLDGYYCSWEKMLPTPPLSPAKWTRDPPQFLFQDSHWSSRLKSSIYRHQATRFTGPISPACDQYIQYLLMSINPSFLNRHRWGLPHRKSRNSHNTLPALPFRGFHWSP